MFVCLSALTDCGAQVLETPFRVNLTTISLGSVQNLPVLLILQMVMFIRSTSPAQLNVPLTSANKVFYFSIMETSRKQLVSIR